MYCSNPEIEILTRAIAKMKQNRIANVILAHGLTAATFAGPVAPGAGVGVAPCRGTAQRITSIKNTINCRSIDTVAKETMTGMYLWPTSAALVICDIFVVSSGMSANPRAMVLVLVYQSASLESMYVDIVL